MSTERPVHDAAEQHRRRSRLAVASVAATVLLVGGGGAYFAATASGGSGGNGSSPAGDGGTPPPLALDGHTDGDRQEGGKEGGTEGIAPGEPDPNGAAYRAEGKLPGGPDSAAVYHARGTVSREQVTKLADALGLAGKPTSRDGAWQVGPAKDGSGPSLQVSKQAPGTWTFSRYATGGSDNCRKGKPCSEGSADSGTTSTAPNGKGDAVGESEAKKAAAPVLKAVGQDDAKLDADQLMGAVRVVNADPEVGGLPTYGWSTGVQVGSDGQVVGGSGQLKAPEKGATYPVISADETLAQLNKSGGGGSVGIGGCATAMPEDASGEEGKKQAPCEPSSAPPKPQPITVKDATFGLAVQFVDGRQTLVPSWLFDVLPQGAEDTFTVTHPAVEPKFITSPSTPSSPPTPTGKPGQEPGAGGAKDPAAHVESYRADGESLTVHFYGGACGEYSASADESKDSVRVKVTETRKKGEVCVMMAKEFTETVTLDEPLGDRKVVDAQGGGTVPRK
ncbi:membrane protein [Streptomyces longisporoflavus]|uniref:hypothetical protein n=1 Tax=Streptomyces longisporoflavus TaxID=28044 RepID=UPI00167C7DA2|nr:hypothetical protein [Streptomyces longisporoflavus]GGV39283.1 membrane protein [Streptomyces longisporoflavus]